MKKLRAAAALALILLLSTLQVFAFPDVPEDCWCYSVVTRAAEEGLIHGYTDGLFRPERIVNFREFLIMCRNAGAQIEGYENMLDESIPRGYMALILYEMLLRAGATELNADPAEPLYSDSAPGDEYSRAVAACSDAGLLLGYKDGSFRPNAYLKRGEAAAVLVRYIDYLGLDPVDILPEKRETLDLAAEETGLEFGAGGLTFTYVIPEIPDGWHFAVDLHIYRRNSEGGDDTVFYMNSDEGWLSGNPAYDQSPGRKTLSIPGVSSLTDRAAILRFELFEVLEGGAVGEYTSYTYTKWYDGTTTLITKSIRESGGQYVTETQTTSADFGEFIW